jgi:hypothetical protein
MKPKLELTLHIDTSGVIRSVDTLNEEFLDALGLPSRKRASHVWPVHPAKRVAFRILRALFGERGHIAAWCRSWRGPWEVRFANNPGKVVFTHPSRRVCIGWEIATINERLAREGDNLQ